MAEELINAIENADEIFLQPLYDLSEAFAKDIQASFFWPFFPKFITVFGTTLLKVKDHPEVVQAGYTALTNIVRLIMRNVDQENEGQNDIKSLEVLTISLDGLMQNNKGLPVHSQKLCASALGQIIRRSKTKTSCIEVNLHTGWTVNDVLGNISISFYAVEEYISPKMIKRYKYFPRRH